MKSILLFFCALVLFGTIRAQQVQELCGFDQIYQEQLIKDPEFRQRMEASRASWEAYIADKNNTAHKMVVEGNDTIYEIPVVVHVIHTGAAVGTIYNKSDSNIMAWIDFANKVWSATWPSYPGTTNGGTKIPIRFVLARRTPWCTATNGIDRVDGSVLANYASNGLNRSDSNGVSEAQLRSLALWNPSAYYNIFVVNKIDQQDGITFVGNVSSYVTGFAYFAGVSAAADGAYMLSSTVSTSSQTLPHELGHAMGLYHTFQGATGSYPDCGTTQTNCVTDGDLICDTEWSPNNLGQNPCPTNTAVNPCTMLPYNNVQYNIMNYGSCRNRFTQGQAERVVQQMFMYRTSLIHSLALDTVVPVPPVLPMVCSRIANKNPTNAYNVGPCNVSFNNISYSSKGYTLDGFKAYIDHALDYCIRGDISTDLIAGTIYPLSVSIATNTQRIKVFIDYNNDGSFDSLANEEVMYINNAPIGINTVSVTPPLTAALNTPLRMRVMSDLGSAFNVANYGVCDSMKYGQVEDFYVTIVTNIPTATDYISKFAANASDCKVDLNWVYGNKQQKIASLILEHSADAMLFTQLANIGTQISTTSFIDLKPLNGINYYRLKWMNADGSIEYSAVQQVDVHCNSAAKVYPNPFKNQFSLALNADHHQTLKLEIYDVSGKKVWGAVKNIDKGFSKMNIDLNALPDAVYILKINGDDTNDQIMIVKGRQ